MKKKNRSKINYVIFAFQIGLDRRTEKLEKLLEIENVAMVEDVDSRKAFAQRCQHGRRIKGRWPPFTITRISDEIFSGYIKGSNYL